MAVLSDADRQALANDIMRALSSQREPLALLKAQVRQFINETDDWINSNASAYNLALSLAIRTALTAAQKSRGFRLVAQRRYEVGA